MVYAKFMQGYIVTAKNDAERELPGYKPVTFADPPEAPEGYYYESAWEEQADSIVQVWALVELPPEETDLADKAEAYDILMGVEP